MIALDLDQLVSPPPGVRLSPRADVTLPLEAPVTVDGRRFDALRFRRVKPADIRKAERGASGQTLVARLAGVPVEVIHALASADAERAIKVVDAQVARRGRS